MRVATWNVNSIRSRVGRVVDWAMREDVDVLAMQEIKCTEAQFPFEAFSEAGYEVELHGLSQWNGVAIASRLPLTDVSIGFPSAPGFGKPLDDGTLPQEARAIGATVEGVRLWSLYVPNGRELDNPHYSYKLEWLANLATETRAWLAAEPDLPLALMGDFNIAPFDHDVWDVAAFAGKTHVSQPERDDPQLRRRVDVPMLHDLENALIQAIANFRAVYDLLCSGGCCRINPAPSVRP